MDGRVESKCLNNRLEGNDKKHGYSYVCDVTGKVCGNGLHRKLYLMKMHVDKKRPPCKFAYIQGCWATTAGIQTAPKDFTSYGNRPFVDNRPLVDKDAHATGDDNEEEAEDAHATGDGDEVEDDLQFVGERKGVKKEVNDIPLPATPSCLKRTQSGRQGGARKMTKATRPSTPKTELPSD